MHGFESTERGELPKVKPAGAAKAVVSNQRVKVRSSDGSSGSFTRFGRSAPAGRQPPVFVRIEMAVAIEVLELQAANIQQRDRTDPQRRLGSSVCHGERHEQNRRKSCCRHGG